MSVPLPDSSLSLERQDILSLFCLLLVREAAGEPRDGKIAVACVVRNRVDRTPDFGESWRGVMLKPKQFSCFNEPRPSNLLRPTHGMVTVEGWQECGAIAEAVYYGDQPDITSGSLYYFTIAPPPDVKHWPPRWSEKLVKRVEIGRHVFFAEP